MSKNENLIIEELSRCVKNLEKKVAALEVQIQEQPNTTRNAAKITELAARLITCSNKIKVNRPCSQEPLHLPPLP